MPLSWRCACLIFNPPLIIIIIDVIFTIITAVTIIVVFVIVIIAVVVIVVMKPVLGLLPEGVPSMLKL